MELEIRKQNAIFEVVSRAASDILQSAAFEDAALEPGLSVNLLGGSCHPS